MFTTHTEYIIEAKRALTFNSVSLSVRKRLRTCFCSIFTGKRVQRIRSSYAKLFMKKQELTDPN